MKMKDTHLPQSVHSNVTFSLCPHSTMSFEEQRPEGWSARPPLNMRCPAGDFTTGSWFTSFLDCTKPTNDIQCSAANHLHASTEFEHVSAGRPATTEHYVEGQWLDLSTPDIFYLQPEPQQQFPMHNSSPLVEYFLPSAGLTASVHQLATHQSGSRNNSILEWTQERSSLYSSTSLRQQIPCTPSISEELTLQM